MSAHPDSLATIFVSIASYRDSDGPNTLRDLFDKARHPERVCAGVLWQILPTEDDPAIYTRLPDLRAAQVRDRTIHVSDSLGACWARHRIQEEFYQNEDYYLQIDSHTRFDPEWDVQLIAMLHACPSPKPILSTHPNRFEPPDTRLAKGYPHLRAKKFNRDQILIPQGEYIALDARPPAPRPSAFVGGGLLFGPGSMVHEVPYDPRLYFHGEEITLSVRLWTHGYDLYSPNDIILYHDYTNKTRPRHWDDHKVDWTKLQKISVARLEHLLEIRPSTDPEVLQEIERFGLGQVRTLAEYEAYADVDLRRRVIGTRASDGRFPAHPPTNGPSVERQRLFTKIYLENQWGSGETRSGSGSMVQGTEEMRTALRDAMRLLGIRSVVDAGCGDLNWISLISEEWDLYLGFDVVRELIAHNRTLYGQRPNHFFNVADICQVRLPRADALLCRNTLTHLPNEEILQALRLFKRSECRHLIATTFPGVENEKNKIGQWHRTNLTAPPFSLPEPIMLLPDGKSRHERYLGIWRLAEW
ncbi:MAG: hypothetical protein G8237_11120 [Magnetococcales bacterium]|nr:hypothetical protein [Magnetococcales bacterium]NGZ06894.1 hypothetical protein [Magnetococcales bacterium]